MKNSLNDNTFSLLAKELASCDVRLCYQCGKCTAGCPVAERMEIKTHALVSLALRGEFTRALHSEAIWACVSCHTCSQRCPKKVDTAGVLDALRHEAYRRGTVPKNAGSITAFYKSFAESIRLFGRSYEVGMMAGFNFYRPLSHSVDIAARLGDAKLGLDMLTHGRLHLFPEKVHDTGVVRRIFERCLKDAQ